MYIIYDCEGTLIGMLTENSIRHTTIKEDLGSGFIIAKVEDYKRGTGAHRIPLTMVDA